MLESHEREPSRYQSKTVELSSKLSENSHMEEIERLARLEAQHEEVMRMLREIKDENHTVRQDVADLKKSLTQWRGIGAGIAITVSLIWTAGLTIYSFFTAKG